MRLSWWKSRPGRASLRTVSSQLVAPPVTISMWYRYEAISSAPMYSAVATSEPASSRNGANLVSYSLYAGEWPMVNLASIQGRGLELSAAEEAAAAARSASIRARSELATALQLGVSVSQSSMRRSVSSSGVSVLGSIPRSVPCCRPRSKFSAKVA